MESCPPSSTDDCFKVTSGDLYQTISSGNSDDVIRMIETSNLKDNYFDQTTLDQGLLMACDRGRKLVVQHLLLKGASIDARDPLGYTPLLLAVEKGYIEIVRILLDKGADVKATNMRGDSALTLSVKTCGSKDMVSLLLEQNSVDVNHRNKDGYTCWMKAVEALDFDTLKLLIRSGKGINKDLNSFKEQTNKTVTTSVTERLDTRTFNVHAIISLLEREVDGSKNSLRHAVFERDLNSVRYLMDYEIVDKNDERLLIEFMEDIWSKSGKQCNLNETEFEIIRKLLQSGAEFYLTSSLQDRNVLVLAVKIGSCELVDLLCQHVSISNSIISQYSSALVAVAHWGRCDLLKILLKYANTYNIFERISLTFILETALEKDNVNVLELLIKNGATIDVESSLNIAAAHKGLNSLRFFIGEFSNICRSAIHDKCKGLFHKAVELGDLDIINTLLDLGCDVNCLFEEKNPLMMTETPEVMELLIKRGANVKPGENLLIHIILNILNSLQNCEHKENEEQSSSKIHFKEMVEILSKNGVSVNETNFTGQSPLMVASQCYKGGYVLEVLLEAGAEVNKADYDGVTALHVAVSCNCLWNVEILIEAGADVNMQGLEGHTVLHEAIYNEEILKCLLRHGADVHAEDAAGNSALMLAVFSRNDYDDYNMDVLRLLLEAGSNVNHQNATGETALMKAASSQNYAAIKILCEANADVKLRTRDKDDVISIFVDRMCHLHKTDGEVVDLMFYLLDKGASSLCVNLKNLYHFILRGCLTTVQRLVEAGLGPSDIAPKVDVDVSHTNPFCTKRISPFCCALLCNQVTLARYFSDIWYLTSSDVSTLTHDNDVRSHLTTQGHKESLTFLEEFSSQPISLQKLSFVAVSTSIGTGPDRELKVRGLHLSNMLKNKLMFSTGHGQKLPIENEQQFLWFLSVLFDVNYNNFCQCARN